MNEVLQAIIKRRSIRKYKTDQVSSANLTLILKAGQAAPSAHNQQPWYFVAIQKPELIQQLAALDSVDEDPYYHAPTIILVFAKKTAYSPVTDGTLALGNMMLAAHSLGLGSCWIDYSCTIFNNPEFSGLQTSLGVPDGYFCVGSLSLGYPDEQPESHTICQETISIVQ